MEAKSKVGFQESEAKPTEEDISAEEVDVIRDDQLDELVEITDECLHAIPVFEQLSLVSVQSEIQPIFVDTPAHDFVMSLEILVLVHF